MEFPKSQALNLVEQAYMLLSEAREGYYKKADSEEDLVMDEKLEEIIGLLNEELY